MHPTYIHSPVPLVVLSSSAALIFNEDSSEWYSSNIEAVVEFEYFMGNFYGLEFFYKVNIKKIFNSCSSSSKSNYLIKPHNLEDS